ncbi:MAG: REP-associated tyrosine transposase [Terriglobales bacterium]
MLKNFYRRNLPHLQRDDKAHFLTFCTHQRKILPDWARDIVLQTCLRADQWTIDLEAVVVMPDHVHLIFVPSIDTNKSEVISLARITKAIKGGSAHLINRKLGTTGQIWQEESFDRVLRSTEKLEEKILYVMQNPVRQGLVGNWRDYPWIWCKTSELRSAGR